MKIRLTENILHEGFTKDDIRTICDKIGRAHDFIIEAQDLCGWDAPEELSYLLDDLEASLSEYDFMGEDDPAQAMIDALEIEEDDDDEVEDEEEIEEEK